MVTVICGEVTGGWCVRAGVSEVGVGAGGVNVGGRGVVLFVLGWLSSLSVSSWEKGRPVHSSVLASVGVEEVCMV